MNESNADAGTDVEAPLRDRCRHIERSEDRCRRRGRARRILGVAQQDGELVTTEASNHISVGDTALQTSGDLDQQRIASGVSEAVVDRLEVVEIDEQHGAVTPVVLPDGLLQMRAEQRAVGQTRERIVQRLKCQSAAVYDWRHPIAALLGVVLMEFGDFAMMRRMLLGIKARAESPAWNPGPFDSAVVA